MTVTGRKRRGPREGDGHGQGAKLTSLDIDPSIFNEDDKEVVEDLILAAIKDAQAKAQAKSQEQMAKLTEEMGLPAVHEDALLRARGLVLLRSAIRAVPRSVPRRRPARYRGAESRIMARLPGLGPRSARRAVLHLIKKRGDADGTFGRGDGAGPRTVRAPVSTAATSPPPISAPSAATRAARTARSALVEDVADLLGDGTRQTPSRAATTFWAGHCRPLRRYRPRGPAHPAPLVDRITTETCGRGHPGAQRHRRRTDDGPLHRRGAGRHGRLGDVPRPRASYRR